MRVQVSSAPHAGIATKLTLCYDKFMNAKENPQNPDSVIAGYSEKEQEYLSEYLQERPIVTDAVLRVNEILAARGGIAFDRPGFFGELAEAQKEMLAEKFPEGMHDKTRFIDRHREASPGDMDKTWAMGGDGAYYAYLNTFDLHRNLESRGLVSDEDRDLMLHAFPQYTDEQYVTHDLVSDQGIFRRRAVVFREQKKNLIKFRDRANINEIDAAIQERKDFLSVYEMFARGSDKETVLKYFSSMPPALLERAEECARAGDEVKDGSLVEPTWGHWLLKVIRRMMTTEKLLRFLERAETYTLRD
jgi:hypothetical protein